MFTRLTPRSHFQQIVAAVAAAVAGLDAAAAKELPAQPALTEEEFNEQVEMLTRLKLLGIKGKGVSPLSPHSRKLTNRSLKRYHTENLIVFYLEIASRLE